MAYRKISLVVLMVLGAHALSAQDVTVTMLEQLSALKGYISVAEKGYKIVEDGLHGIGDIKNGEFDLHRVFFGSLKTVDPGVEQYPALQEAYQLIASINQTFATAIPTFESSGWLQTEELAYITELGQNLAVRGQYDLYTMRALTRDGDLSMTDGQRIQNMDRIRADIRRRNSQVKVFLLGVTWLITQREKEGTYTGTLKKWYGL